MTYIYFVYTLLDADGEPVYIGRTSKVARRIYQHSREALRNEFKASWFYRARSVAMAGPFSYDIAMRVERDLIDERRPVGNCIFNRNVRRGVPA